MSVSIIIVNYKSQDKLRRSLESIVACVPKELLREVIVVENNSGDVLDNLREEFGFKLLLSPKNLGMGGGNNIGLKVAQGEFALVLNPDTVLTPGALETLHNYLKKHEEVAIVAPKLLYPDQTLQFSCFEFPRFYTPILRRTFLGDYFKSKRDGFMMEHYDHNKIMEVDWVMGSCFLMRKIKHHSGERFMLFDDRYFMYFEDTDLCRQLKRLGYKIVYNPEAVVIHDHRRESAKKPWYIAPFTEKLAQEHIKSWLKYFAKWWAKRR